MSDPQTWSFMGLPALLWIPLLPLLGSAINLLIGKRIGKPGAGLIAVFAVGGACLLAGFEVFGGLFYHACVEVAGRAGLHVAPVQLTAHPMPVEGLVVAQAPAAGQRVHRDSTLTVQLWHPPGPAR